MSWGNWASFEDYTRTLTFFLPKYLSQLGAYGATFLEILFSILLLIGFKTRITALSTFLLLTIFALAMSIAFGVKVTFDYSVWISATAAFLLAVQSQYLFSIDQLMVNKQCCILKIS
ncbi:DoxX family membrane protein [Empedobacter tilapiae]